MKVGVSTASLYPLHVEDGFRELAIRGIKTAEVFANSTCEGQEPYISMIKGMAEEHGMTIPSFHPFSSPMESVFLFSTYDRRIEEMLSLYRGFFGSMQKLGAEIFVLHGAILSSKCTKEHYFRQFRLLSEIGREYGITVAQENVCYCLSGNLEFLRDMKRELGEHAKFVLDLKQARRAGNRPSDYVTVLGSDIVHCHVSDADADRECLPVGAGDFDFIPLFRSMRDNGFDGSLIVELYRSDYEDFDDLKTSAENLAEIVDRL
ncbi:MAG: sugar phosphate isomerase/epimerase [Oscillospiraceae bacterium]|nr:sugar phosphate isomerase/epimerase [Oscillospiraceae bacterium]